ncbi:MAG: hypothetical protein J5594_04500 [Elusimicrobiaceae bacterium]|nr:hypothetical protein [Elusimicrobiaceae bacterium]
MKKIYRCFFISFSMLAFCTAFAAQNNTLNVGELKSRLIQDVKKATETSSLYSVVRQEIEDYYGLQDFSDPNHETGWYRVDDFLKWVQNNEETLKNANVTISDRPVPIKDLYSGGNLNKKEKYYYPFWAYLGARYISHVYGVNTNFEKIKLYVGCVTSSTVAGTGAIFLCLMDGDALPGLINTGIHETTHSLPYLENNSDYSLSELATFYSVYNYGLPVKSKDAVSIGDGVRDIRRTIELRPDLDILVEYNYYLAGLILNSNIRLKDVFLLRDEESIYKISIKNFCFNLVALKNNKFFAELDIKGGKAWPLSPDYFQEREIASILENQDKTIYLGKKSIGLKNYKHLFAKFLKEKESGELYDYVNIFEGIRHIGMEGYLKGMFGIFINSKINRLYDDLYKGLPKEFIDEVNKNSPVQIQNTYQEWKGYEIVEKYDSEIRKVILQTLKRMNIPEAKIPEGYI